MDPKAQMPDIKAEVNKVDDGKDKKKGALGSLFGGGGAGGSGAGGLAGLGGGGGAAGFGGLLATKAGILALVVMGTAVAGGLGLVGYKAFGPGDADKPSNISLFAPKPKAPEADPNAPAASADGNSASLEMMAKGAAADRPADGSAAAPTDQTAGDAAKAAADEAAKKAAADEAAKKTAGTNGPINSGGGAGATGNMSHLQGVKKLGALSGLGAASGGGSSANGSARAGGPEVAASKVGSSAAFSKSGTAAKTTSLSAGRGISSRRGSGARQQLASVLKDNRGASSSFGAGRTYDGAGASGGNGIDGGNAIGVDGTGTGGTSQPKELHGNSANNVNDQEHIPEPPGKDVTPWQKQINGCMMLLAAAGLLMLAASALLKDVTLAKAWTVAVAKVLLGLAIAAAAAAMILGGMVAFGNYGQKLQGGLLITAGLFVGGAATYMLSQIWSMDPKTEAEAKAASTVAADSSTLMYIMGGAGAAALCGAMMAPKQTMKERDAKEKGVTYGYVAPAPVQDYYNFHV